MYRVLGGFHERTVERWRDFLKASILFGKVPGHNRSHSKGRQGPKLLANRKPISMINSMAKVLESLQEFVEENEIFTEKQFGFKA